MEMPVSVSRIKLVGYKRYINYIIIWLEILLDNIRNINFKFIILNIQDSQFVVKIFAGWR